MLGEVLAEPVWGFIEFHTNAAEDTHLRVARFSPRDRASKRHLDFIDQEVPVHFRAWQEHLRQLGLKTTA